MIKLFSLIFLLSFYSYAKTKVAIIDSGIYSHKQLKKYTINKVSNSVTNEHGTHLACILLHKIDPNDIELYSYNMYELGLHKSLELAIKEKVDYILFAGSGIDYNLKEYNLLLKASRQGILIITSAGNDHINVDEYSVYPCKYRISNIRCVGNNKFYSNTGSNIIKVNKARFESCSKNNKYIVKEGTSQSAAFYLNTLLRKD